MGNHGPVSECLGQVKMQIITQDNLCACGKAMHIKKTEDFIYKNYHMGPVEYYHCRKCKKNYYKPQDKEWWKIVVQKNLQYAEQEPINKNQVILLATLAGITLGTILVMLI